MFMWEIGIHSIYDTSECKTDKEKEKHREDEYRILRVSNFGYDSLIISICNSTQQNESEESHTDFGNEYKIKDVLALCKSLIKLIEQENTLE